MTSWITICETCKREGWDAESGMTDGEALAAMIEPLAEKAGVKTRRVSCTMGCERACNVIVQGEGKIGYSLGKFDADLNDAKGIVAFAEKHQHSETGQVPFREWPAEVKGHFVSRQIPLPKAP